MDTLTSYVLIDEYKVPKNLDFLIVEDENDVAEILKETLIEEGFNGSFTISHSTEEATKLIHETEKPFDFIISDWNLIGLSGLDLLMQVKSERDYKKTPFLMVTANDNVSGMLITIKKGASDYLVKPWEPAELLEKIGSAWHKNQVQAMMPEASS